MGLASLRGAEPRKGLCGGWEAVTVDEGKWLVLTALHGMARDKAAAGMLGVGTLLILSDLPSAPPTLCACACMCVTICQNSRNNVHFIVKNLHQQITSKSCMPTRRHGERPLTDHYPRGKTRAECPRLRRARLKTSACCTLPKCHRSEIAGRSSRIRVDARRARAGHPYAACL